MPSIPTRRQQPSPVSPQVPIPNEFPAIPKEVLDRFPSAKDWQTRLNEFWGRTAQALQESQRQTAAQVNSQVIWTVDRFLVYTTNGGAMPMFALDDTGIRLGNVLVINTPGRKVYIGAGNYANDDTPFYIDTLGQFSLGASLTWNPDTDTLTITGIINATSGTIGGFDIGADYIRDTGNSFGLASTVSGIADIRFWAGATFANRYSAPVWINEVGDCRIERLLSTSIELSGNITSSVPAGISMGSLIIEASAGFAYGIDMGTMSMSSFAAGDWLRGINGAMDIIDDHANLLVTPFYARLDFSSGPGSILNAYGLYIDTVNIGTNNYGVYVATTAKNYFAGGIIGTSTNDSATAGNIGEFLSANAAASAVALTDVTPANATSISLTAGDWLVTADIRFAAANAGTVTTYIEGGLSQTSATLPAEGVSGGLTKLPVNVNTNLAYISLVISPIRISLSATTTIYLVAQATFSAFGLNCGGSIRAWRVR